MKDVALLFGLCILAILLIDRIVTPRLRGIVARTLGLPGLGWVSLFAMTGLARTALFALGVGCVLALLLIALFSGWLDMLSSSSDIDTARSYLKTLTDVRTMADDVRPVWGWAMFGTLAVALMTLTYRQSRIKVRKASMAALEAELAAAARAMRSAKDGEPPDHQPGTLELMGLFTTEARWRREYLFLRAEQFEATAKEVLAKLGKAARTAKPSRADVAQIAKALEGVFVGFARDPAPDALLGSGILVLFDNEALEQGRQTLSGEIARIEGTAQALRAACRRLAKEDGPYATISAEQVMLPVRPGFWPALGRVFSSCGPLATTQAGSRWTMRASLLLLIPSLLGVQATPIVGALSALHTRASDFYIALSEAEAAAAWAKYKPPPELPEELPDDEAAIRTLTRAYELGLRGLVRNQLSGAVAGIGTHLLPSRFALSRDGVIAAAARRVVHGDAAALAVSAAHTDVLPQAVEERPVWDHDPHHARIRAGDEAAEMLRTMYAQEGPATSLGRDFETRLRAMAHESDRAVWRDMKRKARDWSRSFHEPLTAGSVREHLVLQAIGLAGDTPELGTGLPPRGRQYFAQSTGDEFLKTLASGSSVDDAVRSLSHSAPHYVFLDTLPNRLERLDATLKPAVDAQMESLSARRTAEHAPSLARFAPHAPVEHDWKVKPGSAADDAVRAAEHSLGSFNTAMGDGMRGILEALRNFRFNGHGFGGHAPTAHSAPHVSSPKRIRKGVIAAALPDPAAAAQGFRTLTWRSGPQGLTLDFERDDGARIALPPHDAGIVHLALVSAASEDRWIASFDLTTQPETRAVWLPPGLVDTRLGCQILRLDQLGEIEINNALEATDADRAAQPELAGRGLERRSATYTGALAAVFWSQIIDQVPSDNGGFITGAIRSEARRIGDDTALMSIIDAGLGGRMGIGLHNGFINAWLSKADASANADTLAKTTSEVRRTADTELRKCVAASRNADGFKSCSRAAGATIAETVGLQAASQSFSVDDFVLSFNPPPAVLFSTVLSERPYTEDSGLRFAWQDAPVLNYIPQAVAYTPGQELTNHGAGTLNGTPLPIDPASFDLETREASVQLKSFLQLRRLFSMAFSGRLGPDFTYERLVDLARETAPRVTDMALPRSAPAPSRWGAQSLLSCAPGKG